MCGECEMQSRTGTGAHGDGERCSCYYEGLRGTPTPTGIDHDHEWALWCEKWRAEGERAGREAEREAIRKIHICGDEYEHDGVYVEWRGRYYGKGPILWAVTWRGRVLSRDGEWEFEPIPSSRDEQFIARCRFGSLDDAIAAAIRARGAEKP